MDQDANATLNDGGGESSTPLVTGGLVSTTEFVPSTPDADADPEGANKPEGADKGSEGPEAGKDAGADADAKADADKLSGQDDRLDKHPRFQEFRTRAEAAEARVTKLEGTVAKLSEGKVKKGAEELPYKDVSKMTTDELLDWQSDDPHGYHKNILAQAKHELGSDFEKSLEKKSGEDAIVSTFQTFAEKNPDFDTMWDQKVIQRFMDANPGHNAISAYHELTAEKRTQDAIDKAVKTAEENFVANQKAKRTKKSISAGPQTTGTKDAPVDAELQNTKQFGGTTRVLANRLKALRQKQAAG
jgi:hypothetical protein